MDSLELVKKLVAYGADVNAPQKKEPRDGNRNMLNRIGATPFLLAAKAVDLPLMRALLAEGADPTLPNVDGTTPLMVAAGVGIWAPGESPGTEEEAIAAVKMLLELGAGKVTDVDKNGYTAAHGAVHRGGSVAILNLLVDPRREARREEQQGLDAAHDRGRRRIHARHLQALSGDGGSSAQDDARAELKPLARPAKAGRLSA